ncbi:MAG: hypothetical protein AAB538_02260 [Patescibacteria group bacterium]
MQARFHTLVTHERPHFDEVVAIWLLLRFGEEHGFPGVSEAKIVLWRNDNGRKQEKTPEAYEAEGVILIGVGGGRFDEHPTPTHSRKEDECAATLVAEALGIRNDIGLRPILNFALKNDLKGAGHPFDIAHILKLLYNTAGSSQAIAWVFDALGAKHAAQTKFFDEAWGEFHKSAQIDEVPGHYGHVWRVASIESDSDEVANFARSQYGARASVVIVRRTSGNVQILVDQKAEVPVLEYARAIRHTEQLLKGDLVTTDFRALEAEGAVPGTEEWFLHYKLGALMNGSLSLPDVPPTRIPFAVIRELVVKAINPALFEPTRSEKCTAGICTSSLRNPCPWYNWGLKRCRKIRRIRFEMTQGGEAKQKHK